MRIWTIVALIIAGFAAFLAFLVWAVLGTQGMGSWTGGSKALLAAIIGGAVFTGGLTGILMWLAFYSDRKGYDEPFRLDEIRPKLGADAESTADDGHPAARDRDDIS